MKKLVLFDIDKTIYNSHSFFAKTKYCIDKGRAPKETWDLIQDLLVDYKAGKCSYSATANKLLSTLSKAIKGQKYSDLYNDAAEFFTQNRSDFYPYFEQILPKLKEQYDVYLITTNTDYVALALINMFGLAGYISTVFEVKDGIFTGNIVQSLAYGKTMVADLIAKYGKQGSIAVGDSENDIGMLELVENPICINPSSELAEIADTRKWAVTTDTEIAVVFDEILKK